MRNTELDVRGVDLCKRLADDIPLGLHLQSGAGLKRIVVTEMARSVIS